MKRLYLAALVLALAAVLAAGCEPSSSGGLEQDALEVGGDVPLGEFELDAAGDVDKDQAQPDVEPDSQVEWIGDTHAEWFPPDVHQDSVEFQHETVLPTEPRGFRVTGLSVDAPELCYPMDALECYAVNDVVNSYLDGALVDEEQPLDFLGFFQEFMSPEGAHDLDFGSAVCDRDNGDVEACWFDAASQDSVDRLSVHYLPQGQCGSGIPAPCFLSDPASVQMDLPFFGITLALVGAEIRGSFSGQGLSQLTGGVIHGLLPLSHASNVQLCMQQGVCVLLSDLFVYAPLDEVDGIAGWWVTLSLEGVQVGVPAG